MCNTKNRIENMHNNNHWKISKSSLRSSNLTMWESSTDSFWMLSGISETNRHKIPCICKQQLNARLCVYVRCYAFHDYSSDRRKLIWSTIDDDQRVAIFYTLDTLILSSSFLHCIPQIPFIILLYRLFHFSLRGFDFMFLLKDRERTKNMKIEM